MGKATSLDNIPCKLLKIAADVVAPSLTCIFNPSLLTGIYPSDWKVAKVIPFFKNGSKTDLNNYRPISVIPAAAKIFEKIIYDQLCNYLNANDLLTSCQSGFRSTSRHYCLAGDKQQLVRQCWQRSTQWCNFHWLKESLWHYRSRNHLAKYGVDHDALKWFKSYLANRLQRCNVNNYLSSTSPLNCGVPQGSIIGPLLFFDLYKWPTKLLKLRLP